MKSKKTIAVCVSKKPEKDKERESMVARISLKKTAVDEWSEIREGVQLCASLGSVPKYTSPLAKGYQMVVMVGELACQRTEFDSKCVNSCACPNN